MYAEDSVFFPFKTLEDHKYEGSQQRFRTHYHQENQLLATNLKTSFPKISYEALDDINSTRFCSKKKERERERKYCLEIWRLQLQEYLRARVKFLWSIFVKIKEAL